MADILINNKKDAENFILFDSIPNIVTIKSSTTSQTKATYEFDFSSTSIPNIVENAVIEVNGFQVSATTDLQSARGRKFYIPSDKESLAVNVMMALQNIPNLAMLYDFYHINETVKFTMTSKDYGSASNITVRFNPSLDETDATQIEPQTVTSTVSNDLYGQQSSKIYLDIYSSYGSVGNEFLVSHPTSGVLTPGQTVIPSIPMTQTSSTVTYASTPQYIPTQMAQLKYTVTLEKEFYDEVTNFNISPILNSLTEENDLTIFRINAYCIKDGQYMNIGESEVNYATKGYMVNNGDRYVDFDGEGYVTYMLAANVAKGTNSNTYNKSTLFVYEPTIRLSLFYANGTVSYRVRYLASDESVIEEIPARKWLSLSRRSNLSMKNVTITLDEEKLRRSFYVDILFDFGTLRYNVINPPYGNIDNTRVYWYNSYGGISFFDFTGERKEERKSSSTTYDKTLLDYYTSQNEEQAIVYFKDNELSTTLTTHLMDRNGLYQLYDLQRSYKAWIEMDGRKYYIIVSEVSVEEPHDNTYRATIKFNYSLMDSYN